MQRSFSWWESRKLNPGKKNCHLKPISQTVVIIRRLVSKVELLRLTLSFPHKSPAQLRAASVNHCQRLFFKGIPIPGKELSKMMTTLFKTSQYCRPRRTFKKPPHNYIRNMVRRTQEIKLAKSWTSYSSNKSNQISYLKETYNWTAVNSLTLKRWERRLLSELIVVPTYLVTRRLTIFSRATRLQKSRDPTWSTGWFKSSESWKSLPMRPTS